MKKKLIAIIASVLVLSLLAGCGSQPEGRELGEQPFVESPQVIEEATPVQVTETETSAQELTGIEDYCSDSDGGVDKFQKGITKGIMDGDPFRETDICFDSKTLVETYCEGDELAMKYIKCSGECIYGECH